MPMRLAAGAIAVLMMLVLSGCTQSSAPDDALAPAAQPDVPVADVRTESLDFVVMQDDIQITIDSPRSNVTLRVEVVDFERAEDANTRWFLFFLASHENGKVTHGGVHQTGRGKETVNVAVDDFSMGAGPPLRETLLGDPWFLSSAWEATVPSGHYHILFGAGGGTAQVRLNLTMDHTGGTVSSPSKADIDAVQWRTSLDDGDWDDRTEVWLTATSATRARHTVTTQGPLHTIRIFGSQPIFLRSIERPDGSMCDYNNRFPAGTIGMLTSYGGPIGDYVAEATVLPAHVLLGGYVMLLVTEVPGHTEYTWAPECN